MARPRLFPKLVARFLAGRIGPDPLLRSSVQREFQAHPVSQARLGRSRVIFVDPTDTSFLSPNIAILGYYEAATTELWRLLVRHSEVVVDVGANIGWFTVTAAQAAPGTARILAFEPEARAFGLLARTVSANGYANVTLLPQAAWSETTERPLHLSPDTNRGSHSITRKGEGRVTTVACVRLDEELRRRGLDHVDVMKVDVEGAEAQVLEGAGELVATRRIHHIILEWNPDGWRGREGELARLFELYDVYRFDPSVPFHRLHPVSLPLADGGPLSYLYLRLHDEENHPKSG